MKPTQEDNLDAYADAKIQEMNSSQKAFQI